MQNILNGFATALVLILSGCAATGAGLDKRPDFQATVDEHITAIESRDLPALLETVTLGESITVIFPGGNTLTSRNAYVEFHKNWFADDSWSMEIEPVSSWRSENTGIALVHWTYTDAEGSREALLSLTFHLEDGRWRLVFDQNTRIDPSQ